MSIYGKNERGAAGITNPDRTLHKSSFASGLRGGEAAVELDRGFVMDIQRLASFTDGDQGGNPAGVVISDTLPEAETMQRVATDVGYSETAFVARDGAGFRVRYFAPEAEVPFCGHATIALGAALGQAFGAQSYDLHLSEALISVRAYEENGRWGATLRSPRTSYEAVPDDVLTEALELFGLDRDALVEAIPSVLAHGGALHLVLPLREDALVTDMEYDFDVGAAFMRKIGVVTVLLCHRRAPDLIHARNAFAGHGVYEDPATGAAAAALAGYLRDADISDVPFTVLQGAEMGMPSRLQVRPLPDHGGSVEVSGTTRPIT